MGCFQNERDILKTPVLHDPGKRLFADVPPAQSFMSVDMARECALAIVKMHPPELAETDDLVKMVEGPKKGFFGPELVTRGEDMAGIDAYPQLVRILAKTYDVPHFLERRTHIGTLSRGGLNHRHYRRDGLDGGIQAMGDIAETLVYADLVQMGSRMEIKPIQP